MEYSTLLIESASVKGQKERLMHQVLRFVRSARQKGDIRPDASVVSRDHVTKSLVQPQATFSCGLRIP